MDVALNRQGLQYMVGGVKSRGFHLNEHTVLRASGKNGRYDIDVMNEAVLVWPNRFKGGDKYVKQHLDLAYTESSGRLR